MILASVTASSGGSNTTAIVAIIAGAVISLVGSGVAVWVHRSQLRFQRGETDRAEVKAILDSILENIYLAQMVSGHLLSVSFYAGNEEDPSIRWQAEAPEFGDQLADVHLKLLSDLNRIGLRLGDAAGAMVDKIAATANDISAVETMSRAKIGIHDRLREHFEAIQECRIDFSERARQFTLARLS